MTGQSARTTARTPGISAPETIELFLFARDQVAPRRDRPHGEEDDEIDPGAWHVFGLMLGAAHAQTVERIDVTEFGIYTADTIQIVGAPQWSIELWDGDRKLASQSFQVVKE